MKYTNIVLAAIMTSVIPAGAALADDANSRTHRMGSEQPVTDTWITAKVKGSLLADEVVASTDISVETVNGVVKLTGVVEDATQADRAVEIARGIDGVRSVNRADLRLSRN